MNDPFKERWPFEENGQFLKIEKFPCELQLFAKYLPQLKEIFKIKEVYSEEARKRSYTIFFSIWNFPTLKTGLIAICVDLFLLKNILIKLCLRTY